MNKTDRQETQEMLQLIIAGYVARSESQYDIIESKLDDIRVETKKTNGSVTQAKIDIHKLKLDMTEHPITCQHNKRVEELYISMTNMTSIRKFVNRSLIVASTCLGMVYIAILIWSKYNGAL